MGLFDRLFRGPPGPPGPAGPPGPESTIDADLVRRLGKNEAECENLILQWQGYRDEIKRLVNRLEKRDQRAEAREAEETEGAVGVEGQLRDIVTERVQARRRGGGG